MVRTPEWPLWIEGKHRCLWINGISGAGKSILASYVAEEIEKYCISSSTKSLRLGHAYYYCYFGHDQDESSHFLRWVIGQLCRQSDNVPEALQTIYQSSKTPTLSSLLSVLHSTMEGFERVYLVLDAVDESTPRENLLRVIRDLSTDDRFSALGLIVTSRQYIDIEQALEACSIPITMSNPFVEDDIRTLVRSTVQSDARYQRWPEDLRCDLQEKIPRKAKGMFRWAVCQLDILKRLKPDVSIIMGALSNLPKTLDETYERIFLAIPEDDWFSVQHVFHWLVYHNDLFLTKMSLSTLLQAVQQSTMDFLSHNADQLHDFEGLRECCGCLIMVEQENIKNSNNVVFHKRSTVSFAHYTVKEYLQSTRIAQKKVGFFALAQERVQKQFAGIALRQSLAIQPKHCQYDELGESLPKFVDADFKLYCGLSSMLQLWIWPQAISSDTTLMELCEALVNPHRPAYEDLLRLLLCADTSRDFMIPDKLQEKYRFWLIAWRQISNPDLAVFLSCLIISGYDKPHLALAFARRHSMLAILTQQLHIGNKWVWHIRDEKVNMYDFQGSIPEIVAQWASRQPETFDLILDLISELGVTHFDISTVLLLYIGCHNHEHCQRSCPLERLLCLEASANGPDGAFVTPLQIAEVCWDLHGVKTLLNAGADPNALGKNSPKWSPNSLMKRFNRLHGASSLHIIKHFGCNYRGELKDKLFLDATTREKIEIRLLESGAVEIEPEPGFDDLSDEDNISEDDSSGEDDSDSDESTEEWF